MQSFHTSSGSQLLTHVLPPKNRRRRSEESSLCYKLVSDGTVNGYSGNPIAIYRNEIEIGIALEDKAISQRTCFTDISSSDKLKFKSPGSNGVYIKVGFRLYLGKSKKSKSRQSDFFSFWWDNFLKNGRIWKFSQVFFGNISTYTCIEALWFPMQTLF